MYNVKLAFCASKGAGPRHIQLDIPSPLGAPPIISRFCGYLPMSTIVQAEASKPQKKIQECDRCKSAGYPSQPIAFEKLGEDLSTGKIRWKLVDGNGDEHVHKGAAESRRKRVVDITNVLNVGEQRNCSRLGGNIGLRTRRRSQTCRTMCL